MMPVKTITLSGTLIIAVAALAWMPVQVKKPAQDKKLEESKTRGKALYEELCITCHMADGKGMPGAIPPLAKSDYFAKNPAKAIYPQKYGLTTPIKVNGVQYSTPMPAQAGISDEEIADLTTYIMNSWGNKGKLVTAAEVEKVKK